jgi:hypothetical protein
MLSAVQIFGESLVMAGLKLVSSLLTGNVLKGKTLKSSVFKGSTLVGLVCSLSIGSLTPSYAATSPPPASITGLINKIDQAANSRQLPALLENFSANYTLDGMSRSQWQQQVSGLWQRYSNLRYTTTIQNWKQDATGISIEITTQIDGTGTDGGKQSKLVAKIQARQYIVNGKVTQQQILNEQVRSSTGSKPPTVDMVVPDKLRPSEDYNVDVIVQEPLNDDVMMGALNEQPVSTSSYGKTTPYKLELLSTGGLFKNTRAPSRAGDYWLSAVFVRPDGITTITRRIHVRRS